MTINAGESFVWCLVKCKECDRAYSKEIGWATFAADVFDKAGWKRGVGGVWLCPECVKTSHLSYEFTYEERRAIRLRMEQ